MRARCFFRRLVLFIPSSDDLGLRYQRLGRQCDGCGIRRPVLTRFSVNVEPRGKDKSNPMMRRRQIW